MNPMMQNLMNNQISQAIAPIKQMMSTATNPQAFLQQMLSRNPNGQEIMKHINNNNGNMQKAFYDMAESKGVNPDEIINALQRELKP